MKKLLLLLVLLGFSSGVFAFEWLNASIGTRYYGGTNYVTLEFDISGSPVPDEGFFGCSSKSALFSPDASNRFGIDWIGSNGVPSVQIDLTSGHISYILQTSYSMPTCANGTDLFFGLGYTGGGSPYIMTHVVALRNLGTTSAPIWTAPFLGFPLECSTSTCSGTGNISYVADGGYTSQSINTMLDHHMTTVYSDKDGVIVPFTGETFNATEAYPSGGSQACYPKENDDTWSELLTDIYKGTTGSGSNNCTAGNALNYEAHPGYDYKATYGTEVKAAASGYVVDNVSDNDSLCIHNGFSSCHTFEYVGIDHENGYVTQYGHLDPEHIYVTPGQHVDEGDVIGLSSDTGVSESPHLHFEVLKLIPGQTNDYNIAHYSVVDPYGWNGEGTDPLETATGIKNTCLWIDGC